MNEYRLTRAWRDARVTKIWDPQHGEGLASGLMARSSRNSSVRITRG